MKTTDQFKMTVPAEHYFYLRSINWRVRVARQLKKYTNFKGLLSIADLVQLRQEYS